MKKRFFTMLALLTAFALVMGMMSCSSDSSSPSVWTVSFNLNGKPGSPPASVKVKDNAAIGDQLPVVADEDYYVFGGWFTAAAGGEEVLKETKIKKSQTLFVHWEEYDPNTQYLIKFDLNGATGNHVHSVPVTKGEAAGDKFPADPVWDDYFFDGWYEGKTHVANDTLYTKDTIIEKNITLYANWRPIVIKFDTNKPEGIEITLDAIDPVTIKKSDAIGDKLPPPILKYGVTADTDGTDILDSNIYFKGWFDAATDGKAVTKESKFDADTTVYAQWYTWNGATHVAIVFSHNYNKDNKASEPLADVVIIETNTNIAAKNWPKDPPAQPGTTPGYNTPDDVWVFIGWAEYESGAGKGYQLHGDAPAAGEEFTDSDTRLGGYKDGTNPITPFAANQVIYANWEPAHGWVQYDPPVGTDVARAEKVVLENSWYAVYQFVVPEGKDWDTDYTGISVSYMVGNDTYEKTNSVRGIRLMGNYTADNFLKVIPDKGVPARIPAIAVAGYNENGNGEFIYDDFSQAWKTVKKALEDLGITIGDDSHTPGPWEWFPITYKIDGSRKSGSHKAENVPSGSGTFYFGIGITGQGGGGTTQWIRDVKLVGSDDTASVDGTPLWFKNGDTLYPAFTGYTTSNGKDGVKEAYRQMVDGSQPTPVDWTPTP